jgi:hypothetical protein
MPPPTSPGASGDPARCEHWQWAAGSNRLDAVLHAANSRSIEGIAPLGLGGGCEPTHTQTPLHSTVGARPARRLAPCEQQRLRLVDDGLVAERKRCRRSHALHRSTTIALRFIAAREQHRRATAAAGQPWTFSCIFAFPAIPFAPEARPACIFPFFERVEWAHSCIYRAAGGLVRCSCASREARREPMGGRAPGPAAARHARVAAMMAAPSPRCTQLAGRRESSRLQPCCHSTLDALSVCGWRFALCIVCLPMPAQPRASPLSPAQPALAGQPALDGEQSRPWSQRARGLGRPAAGDQCAAPLAGQPAGPSRERPWAGRSLRLVAEGRRWQCERADATPASPAPLATSPGLIELLAWTLRLLWTLLSLRALCPHLCAQLCALLWTLSALSALLSSAGHRPRPPSAAREKGKLSEKAPKKHNLAARPSLLPLNLPIF